jgi:hypothetical protein
MTIKIPGPTMADRLLKAMGKKRGVTIPDSTDPYAYYRMKKESFWIALLRPAGKDLPPGHVDIFDFSIGSGENCK